jgi:hypothetical protein
MVGFGVDGFGSTPFGVGTPLPADEPPGATTGLSRYLNPNTGDYLYDTTTRQLAQMPLNRQRVLIALLTERGSSVVRSLGIVGPKKMGTNFDAEMSSAVRSALRPLVEAGAIRIEQIIPRRESTGRGGAVVVYTDLHENPDEPARPVLV